MNFGEVPPRETEEAAAEKKKEIRTCMVKRTYKTEFIKLRNGNYLTQSLGLGEGQEGFTTDGIERDQNRNGWVQFAVARTDVVGWVRAEDLEMGQLATQFKVVHVDDRPVPNISNQENDSVLYKTVSLLCATIVADKDDLSKLGADALEFEQLGREVDLATEFIISMHSPVRQKMDGGNFTLDDLWAIPAGTSWVESAEDRRVVIYVILFKGLDGKVGTLGHGFYDGKPAQAGKRHDQHWRFLLDPNAKGQIYAATRPKGNEVGRQYRMLVLCDFTAETNLTRQQKMLKYAEYNCVCLFSSWTSIITNNEVDDLALVDKCYFDRAMARAFTEIMKKVSLQTHWQVPAGEGLNRTTPLTEAHLRHSDWTCTVFTPETDTGPIRSYRSGPRRTNLNPAGSTTVQLFTGGGGGDKRGRVQVSLDTGVDWPKVVTIIVEIYGRGKRHPVPYARFPEPGPFTTWGALNNIGIKAQWQDIATGNLKEKWLQPDSFPFNGLGWSQARQRNMSPKTAEAYPFASQEFVKILLIRDTLLQVEYQETPERPVLEFVKRGPGIVVKVIEYSHLDQTITIRDQQPSWQNPPRLVSVNENRVALKKLYGDAVFLSPQPGLKQRNLDELPASCAVCAITGKVQGYVNLDIKCTNSATEACFYCKWLRRPCVWTILSELGRLDLNNPYRFIRPPPTDQSGIQTLPGPNSKYESLYESLYAPTEEEMRDDDLPLAEPETDDEDDE